MKLIYKGTDGREELKRVLAEAPKENENNQSSDSNIKPFQFKNPDIVKSDYIQIPGADKVISKFEVAGYNNLNWQGTHFKLQENGLYMPVVPLFMTHFMNVLNSYNSKGKSPLFDAVGNPISEKETQDIALHMLKNHIAVYGSRAGAWTWLDAYFEKEKEKMKIFSEHKVQIDKKGNKILVPQKIEDLENCLMQNCFADLNFNNQGLATKKSANENYVLGKNLYFWFPRNKKVVRFCADSDGMGLDCDRDSDCRGSPPGVFAVAQNKNQGSP